MLHPVGPRRPAVYWRRRLVVLLVLAALLAVGWYGVALLTGQVQAPWTTAEVSGPTTAPQPPAFTRVVPTLGSERTPAAGPFTGVVPAAAGTSATATATSTSPSSGGR